MIHNCNVALKYPSPSKSS